MIWDILKIPIGYVNGVINQQLHLSLEVREEIQTRSCNIINYTWQETALKKGRFGLSMEDLNYKRH